MTIGPSLLCAEIGVGMDREAMSRAGGELGMPIVGLSSGSCCPGTSRGAKKQVSGFRIPPWRPCAPRDIASQKGQFGVT